MKSQKSEVKSRKSEVGSRKSEVGGRKSEVGSQKLEVGSRKKILFFSLFSFLFFLSSCYSFTGSSLSPETKTIQIKDFLNNAPLINPNLAQQFSIAIQNRFLQRTTLKGAAANPDIYIEGEITDYTISPTTISSGTTASTGATIQAAQNKLTITVKVHYENHVKGDEQKSFDRTYSDEAVFDSNLDISTIESSQVKIVNERIINKIFNDIVANW